MTNFKMIKPTGAIMRKLGAKNLIKKLDKIDLEAEDAKENFGKELFEILADNLEEIADDITDLCAAYKGVPREEMEMRSPLVELKELFADDEFAGFFKSALARAAKQS